MIVRWPGHVPAGRVSDQVWSFWDVPPTLAEIAGAAFSRPLDGVSMRPAWIDPEEPIDRPPLYWEFHEGGFRQAARAGRWKAIRHGLEGPVQLYNLEEDLGESSDVAADHPGVVDAMERFLREARTESRDFPVTASEPKL